MILFIFETVGPEFICFIDLELGFYPSLKTAKLLSNLYPSLANKILFIKNVLAIFDFHQIRIRN